jgi:hypothetical protein
MRTLVLELESVEMFNTLRQLYSGDIGIIDMPTMAGFLRAFLRGESADMQTACSILHRTIEACISKGVVEKKSANSLVEMNACLIGFVYNSVYKTDRVLEFDRPSAFRSNLPL